MTFDTVETRAIEPPAAPCADEQGRSQANETYAAPRVGRTGLALLAWAVEGFKVAVTMVVGFVATPYLILFLGAERLGAVRATMQWSGYLPHLHLGLDRALEVLILRSANKGDTAETVALSKTAFRMLLRQAVLVILPIAAVMAWLMPVLVPVSPPLRNELRIGAFIALVNLIGSPFLVFACVLECLQLGYLISSALLGQVLLYTGMAVLFAWAGYEIPGQFIAQTAAILCFSAFITWLALRRLPGFRHARAAEVNRKRLWRLRWPVTITTLSSRLNVSTDYIVIGLVLNPATVVTFSITQRLIDAMGGFVTHHVGGVSWAGLSEVLAKKGIEAFQARVLEILRLLLGLSIVSVGTLAAYNEPFVTKWVGHQYYGGDLLSILTGAQMVVIGIAQLFNYVIDAQGDTRDRAAISAPGAVVNVVLSVILARWVGLYGVALATVCSYVMTDLWVSPYVFCVRYGLSAGALVRTALRATLLSLPWPVMVWMVAHRGSPITSWMELLLELGLTGAAGLAYCAFVVLTREDRQTWQTRFAALASQYRRAA